MRAVAFSFSWGGAQTCKNNGAGLANGAARDGGEVDRRAHQPKQQRHHHKPPQPADLCIKSLHGHCFNTAAHEDSVQRCCGKAMLWGIAQDAHHA